MIVPFATALHRLAPLLLVLMALPAAAERFESFEVGDWAGSAHRRDGDFSHCAVMRVFDTRIAVVLSQAGDGSFRFGLFSPDWALPHGAQYPLRLAVDGVWSASLTGTVRGEHGIYAVLPESASGALRRGRTLAVRAYQNDWQFSLRGSARALDSLSRCVARHVPAQSNPFAAPSTNPFAPDKQRAAPDQDAPTGKPNIEPEIFATLMQTMSLPDYARIDDLVAEDMTWAHYAWRTGPAYGAYVDFIVARPEDGLDSLASDFVGAVLGACTGENVSGAEPSELLTDAEVKRALWSCRQDAVTVYYFATFVLIPDDALMMVFMHLADADGREAARDANTLIVRRMRQVFAD